MKLYTDLGFQTIETNGEWKLEIAPPRLPAVDWQNLRPFKPSDRREVADLIRRVTPDATRQWRNDTNDFDLAWDSMLLESIADFFIGQSTRRWVLERDGKIAAVMLVRGKRLGSPHQIAIHAHPDYRGRVEDELIAAALDHLRQFPARAIQATAANSHPALIDVLERHGFRFLNGLTLMELILN